MSEGWFNRGDVVVCALAGDYGKPRPALVVQSGLFNETHPSVVVCPLTSEITGLTLFRVRIAPSATTGLEKESEVMIDKMSAVDRSRIKQRIGKLARNQMSMVARCMRLWLDLPLDSAS